MTDPTTRALELLGLLESRPTWSGGELARRLGVTPRTLRRDIDRLRSLGYPVHGEPGAAGGYTLGRGAALPPLLLDDDEALAVTMGLSTATAGGLVPDGEAALRALGKLDAVLPSAVRERSRAVRTSLTVAPAWGRRVEPEVLSATAEATRTRRRLRFAYADRHGTASERWVEPHHLLARSQNWYLLAWDVDRRDWRTFRLDRASGATVSEWEFRTRPDLADALHRLESGMPMSAYRYRMRVRVRVPLAEARGWFSPGAGTLVAVDEGTTDLVTGADDADAAAAWLAHVPGEFTVLDCPEVVAALRRLARRLSGAARASG